MRTVYFTQTALDEMNLYKSGRQQLVFKILELIADIQKHPFTGLAKPEALKGKLHGYWSRRIMTNTGWFIRFLKMQLKYINVLVITTSKLLVY